MQANLGGSQTAPCNIGKKAQNGADKIARYVQKRKGRAEQYTEKTYAVEPQQLYNVKVLTDLYRRGKHRLKIVEHHTP